MHITDLDKNWMKNWLLYNLDVKSGESVLADCTIKVKREILLTDTFKDITAGSAFQCSTYDKFIYELRAVLDQMLCSDSVKCICTSRKKHCCDFIFMHMLSLNMLMKLVSALALGLCLLFFLGESVDWALVLFKSSALMLVNVSICPFCALRYTRAATRGLPELRLFPYFSNVFFH